MLLPPGLADSMDGYCFTPVKPFDAPKANGFVLEAQTGYADRLSAGRHRK